MTAIIKSSPCLLFKMLDDYQLQINIVQCTHFQAMIGHSQQEIQILQ